MNCSIIARLTRRWRRLRILSAMGAPHAASSKYCARMHISSNEKPNTVSVSDSADLPRLVYIGDVPIESTYHGSILLYRLFEAYPADKLLIIETDLGRS